MRQVDGDAVAAVAGDAVIQDNAAASPCQAISIGAGLLNIIDSVAILDFMARLLSIMSNLYLPKPLI